MWSLRRHCAFSRCHSRWRSDDGTEDSNGHTEQTPASGAKPDLIRTDLEPLPVNATVEAEPVDAGVAAHCKRTDDSTERENLDHGEPNPARVSKAEHEKYRASRLWPVPDESVLGATEAGNLCSRVARVRCRSGEQTGGRRARCRRVVSARRE